MLSFFYLFCVTLLENQVSEVYENETSSLAIKNGEQAKVSD